MGVTGEGFRSRKHPLGEGHAVVIKMRRPFLEQRQEDRAVSSGIQEEGYHWRRFSPSIPGILSEPLPGHRAILTWSSCRRLLHLLGGSGGLWSPCLSSGPRPCTHTSTVALYSWYQLLWPALSDETISH